MAFDIMKEYLVSLGFKVDTSSLNQAKSAMNQADSAVNTFSSNAVKNFLSAAAGVTAFVAAVNVGISNLLLDLAKADLQTEKFARQMWIGEENARSLKASLDAMGASLEDLYYSPELYRNFVELRKLSVELRAPDELQTQLKFIRSINFEIQKLKLEMNYATQWIAYYYFKYMETPIRKVKEQLQSLNESIVDDMPHWTRVVAQVMSWFGRMGVAIVRVTGDIIEGIDEIGDKIPKNVKLVIGALGALFFFLKLSPTGIFVTAITALILILDDFYTQLDGGESLLKDFNKAIIGTNFSGTFDELVEGVEKFYSKLKDNGSIKNFGETTKNVLEGSKILAIDYLGAIETLLTKINKHGQFDNLVNSIANLIGSFSKLGNSLSSAFLKLAQFEKAQKIFEGIANAVSSVINYMLWVKSIDINALSKLVQGDISGAGQEFGNWFGAVQNYMSQFDNDIKSHYKGRNGSIWDYVIPQNTTTNNSNVTFSPVTNVYGNDPHATGRAVSREVENNWDYLARTVGGWGK